MACFLGAKRALLSLLVIAVLLQAYARPAEWTRELQSADDDEFTSPANRGLVQTATCPSAEKYRRTKRGCLCRKGYGTFVFGYDKTSSNPDANMYPTIFPSGCRYYVDGTDTSMNFPTSKGRCFCFTCPTFGNVKYQSSGIGFLNGYNSGCYPYRYFFGRIRIQGTTCAALTANAAQYTQVQNIITAAFKARFNQFNSTFSPVANQFTCVDDPKGGAAYIGFRLGYLGPFIDAQNQIISDFLSNLCQKTTLCNNLNPQLPGGATTNPVGEASPNPLPPVSSPPAPAPGTSPSPLLPIGTLTTLLQGQADCKEAPIAIPAASLSLLGINVISSLDQCINACNLVPGRTYASYSSVLGTNLLPTCKCFNSSTCTPNTCGVLGLNCLLQSYTIYKYI